LVVGPTHTGKEPARCCVGLEAVGALVDAFDRASRLTSALPDGQVALVGNHLGMAFGFW
jgi:hypothetical protein